MTYEFSTPEFWQKRLQDGKENFRNAVQTGCDWEKSEEGHKKIIAGYLKGKVLDVGCGYGRAIGLMPEAVTDYTGIDICPEFIEEAKKRYPNNKFILGDFRKGDFKNQEFDWALIIGLYSKSPQTKEAQEFRDALEKEALRVARQALILWISKPKDLLIFYA